MKSFQVDLLNSQSSWSIRTKIARGLWIPFNLFLRWRGPRFLSPLRVASLKLFGAKIGKRVLILGGTKVWCPWNLEVGAYSAIGFEVEIYNFAPVRIGESTVISQYVYLCTASHQYQSTDMALYFEPITIGPQAWLAAGAFVAPGISIGEGAVIGANSVVTRNVETWTVAAGNPARMIKRRSLQAANPQPTGNP